MNDAIRDRFPIWDYSWLDKSNVLHPLPMFRFQFRPEDMSGFLEFVTLNRRDISILIHAITDDDIVDHSDNVMWIGEPLKLDFAKLEEFVEQGRNGGIPKELLAVNKTAKATTTPGRRYRPGDNKRAGCATG